MNFQNAAELSEWLDERAWLNLCELTDPQPVPTPSGMSAEQVSFTLQQMIQGNFEAGSEERLEKFSVVASGVTEWTCFDAEDFFGPFTYIDDVELDESTDAAIRLIFDDQLMLSCQVLHVEQVGVTTRRVLPHIRKSEAHLLFEGAENVLTPSQWIERFENFGIKVCFRRLGDTCVAPEDVSADYGGWFLQLPERIADTTSGLMIRTLKMTYEGALVGFDYWSDHSEKDGAIIDMLSLALAKIAISEKQVKVTTGNCTLTPTEWLGALEQGQEYLDSLYGLTDADKYGRD